MGKAVLYPPGTTIVTSNINRNKKQLYLSQIQKPNLPSSLDLVLYTEIFDLFLTRLLLIAMLYVAPSGVYLARGQLRA